MINFRPLCASKIKNQDNIPFYRSGELIHINEEDKNYITSKLSIDCYIDLRTNNEIEKNGKPKLLIDAGLEWKSFPLIDNNHHFRTKPFPTPYDYYDYYRSMLELNKEQFRKIILFFGNFYQKKYVYGCYAGKDRTGLLSVLLLLLAGIQPNDIAKDYMDSGRYLLEKVNYFEKNWKNKGLTQSQYTHRLIPNPDTVFLLIDYINARYKNIHGYMYEIGLKNSDLIHLIENIKLYYSF